MATKDDPGKEQPPRPGESSGAKRPYATIDAKATEVRGTREASEAERSKPAQQPIGPQSENTASHRPEEPVDQGETGAEATPQPAGLVGPHIRTIPVLTHFGAGLLGGLILYLLLTLFGPDKPRETVSPEALKQLSSRVADADQANKAIGTQLHELINTSKEVGGAQSRLATDLRSLQEGTEKQSSAARALSDRVTKLEEAQASAATTPTGEPSEAAKASFARLDRDVGTVKAQADRLSQRISDLKTELQEDLKGAAKSADVAPLAKKISAIEQELQQLAKSDAAHSANASRVVLALELTNLKRAMDRGEGYDKELAEVKKAAGDTLNLAPLERYTEGVPTQAELVRSFRKAANAMLDAEAEPAEGGWLDRLLSGTRSIVRVRKANPSGNDRSPEAVIARMEIALKEGRLDEVLAQSKKLPPKAELAGEEWLKNVEARATVDRALADIDAKLKASLGAGPNTGAEQR